MWSSKIVLPNTQTALFKAAVSCVAFHGSKSVFEWERKCKKKDILNTVADNCLSPINIWGH